MDLSLEFEGGLNCLHISQFLVRSRANPIEAVLVFPHMQIMSDGPYFEGDLLVAMPGIGDPRFERTVIYLCSHSALGAMGLVVNKRLRQLSFRNLLEQLDVDAGDTMARDVPLYAGGPVEPGRGFVLHSTDYAQKNTTRFAESDIAITATAEILAALAQGGGPSASLVVLGYAGWQPGQLDRELAGNGWLTAQATPHLLFETRDELKWSAALASLGVDVAALSHDAGHA
jgi:putative transcriptional regulator